MTNTLIPYSFVPGTKAKASEINANFISLADSIAEINSGKLNNDLSNINAAGLDFIKNNTAPSRNIGEIVASTLPLTDASLHLLDGSLINGSGVYSAFVDYISELVTDYPDLFISENDWQTSVTTYGVCAKFVYDSTNATVRLPKITGILEGTTDATALGDLVEAGLPNISGVVTTASGAVMSSYETGTGAFTNTSVTRQANWAAGSSSGNWGGAARQDINFSASNSNSVYGNSTTVQPQTIKCYYYIVAATSSKTDVQADIDEIATDLNGKADTDLINCTDTANIKMAHNAMPSAAYVNLTIGTSHSTYTAPADGYFSATGVLTDAQCLLLSNTVTGLGSYAFFRAGGNMEGHVFIPVRKGDICELVYTCASPQFRFIYAAGSESEAS